MEQHTTNSNQIEFAEVNIPDSHWAIKCEKSFFVAIVECLNKKKVLVKVNGTDRRGYRIIIQLYDIEIRSTLNTTWNEEEINAVFGTAALFMPFYIGLGTYPQVIFAGNNCMEKTENGIIVGRKEPCMLHVHMLGRGIPTVEYIPGIPNSSPEIGEEFNLKGQGDESKGFKKLPWKEEQLSTFKEMLLDWLNRKLVDNRIVSVESDYDSF